MKRGKSKSSGGGGGGGGLLPTSLKIISSCIKTVSTNASTVVRSAGASVAASISASADDQRDQVTWASFDKLELNPDASKHVLLLGYQNGFQVYDVEDASEFTELVSKRDGPVTFLQMLPFPIKAAGPSKPISLHPLLLVVAGEEAIRSNLVQNQGHLGASDRDGSPVSQSVNLKNFPTVVRFYSLRSNYYVKVLRFRSTVFMVRCSPRIVAVGLEKEIHCIDMLTLEDKFTVSTYPVPHFGGQGITGVNIGYGPMAVGLRWLAYASNNLLVSNTGRVSPKNLTPVISPSTSPSNSTLMARYAMESSKQLAAGIINLGDKGYKSLSKYCPELLPDHSSYPLMTNSGWKARLSGTEIDNAGMVLVKDVVSKAVISQFKAHTSPISALSFDPSGTLLVTASIHGNSINIFRIMPSYSRSGSNNQTLDWTSSHVHLYRLYRGLTSAIIQDISFSLNSEWISIITNKGTCHVFVLSPFGGNVNSVVASPWWSTSSFIVNQQPPPPPPPVTLHVVARIKNNNSGFLNSVSNAASSAGGKSHMPSGAVAAVFYNSVTQNSGGTRRKGDTLEHLLVYTPSGYVIQQELLLSTGNQPNDCCLNTQSGTYVPKEDDEPRVVFEALQIWEVWRKTISPERVECVLPDISDGRGPADRVDRHCKNYSTGVQKLVRSDSVMHRDRSHWYISNAEVHMNSGRLPVWQNSKVHLFVTNSPRIEGHAGGELEIEKIPFHEVEIRRKELMPVFEHFHSMKSGWNDCALTGGRYPGATSPGHFQHRDKFSDETVICHSNPASLSSTESSDGGSSRRIENFLDFDLVNSENLGMPISYPPLHDLYQDRRGTISCDSSPNQNTVRTTVFLPGNNKKAPACVDYTTANNFSTLEGDLISHRRIVFEEDLTSNAGRLIEVPLLNADHFDSASGVITEGPSLSSAKKSVDFAQHFQEGYCQVVEPEESSKLTEGLIDNFEDDDSHCERETFEKDGEDDELLAGMFDLSEEG